MKTLFTSCLFAALASHAVVATAPEDKLAFQNKWAVQVAPLFAKATRGTFIGQDGVALAYAALPHPGSHRSITILQGYNESMSKYQELIADFYNAGFSVYTYDHRGMGFSGRQVANPQIIHVDHFRQYAEDARTFLHQIVPSGQGEKRYLFAHSMGGLVAADLLGTEPQIVDAVVMNAPMFAINTGHVPSWLARELITSNVSRGKGKEYAPGYHDYDFEKAEFSQQKVTHSEMRFEKQREVYRQYRMTVMGGPSNNWVKESMADGALVNGLAPAISPPLLLLQAEEDKLVLNPPEDSFCRLVPHCEIVPIKGSAHESWREIDSIRGPVVERITSFFDTH